MFYTVSRKGENGVNDMVRKAVKAWFHAPRTSAHQQEHAMRLAIAAALQTSPDTPQNGIERELVSAVLTQHRAKKRLEQRD